MRTIYKLYVNSAYRTSCVHVKTACNTSLIIQLAKKSHTTHDSMGLWLIRWQAHVHHKVSGVACGREGTSPLACFVNGGDITRPVNNLFLLAKFGPQNRHASNKAFGCDSAITLFSRSHRQPSMNKPLTKTPSSGGVS